MCVVVYKVMFVVKKFAYTVAFWEFKLTKWVYLDIGEYLMKIKEKKGR